MTGEPIDHAGAELVAGGVGDDAGVGLVADPQAVVGQQAAGVGVVGRHRGLEDVLTLGHDGLVQQARPGQARALTRLRSSAAALVVNVSPRTSSGRTRPVATR